MLLLYVNETPNTKQQRTRDGAIDSRSPRKRTLSQACWCYIDQPRHTRSHARLPSFSRVLAYVLASWSVRKHRRKNGVPCSGSEHDVEEPSGGVSRNDITREPLPHYCWVLRPSRAMASEGHSHEHEHGHGHSHSHSHDVGHQRGDEEPSANTQVHLRISFCSRLPTAVHRLHLHSGTERWHAAHTTRELRSFAVLSSFPLLPTHSRK